MFDTDVFQCHGAESETSYTYLVTAIIMSQLSRHYISQIVSTKKYRQH